MAEGAYSSCCCVLSCDFWVSLDLLQSQSKPRMFLIFWRNSCPAFAAGCWVLLGLSALGHPLLGSVGLRQFPEAVNQVLLSSSLQLQQPTVASCFRHDVTGALCG